MSFLNMHKNKTKNHLSLSEAKKNLIEFVACRDHTENDNKEDIYDEEF